MKAFSLRSGPRQERSFSSLLLHVVLSKPQQLEKKKKKNIQIGKEEVKLSLFTDDIVL